MVDNSDLYGIYYGELSFITQASSLLSISLGRDHLLRHDLLGLWLLASAQVHPPTITNIYIYIYI